MHNTRTVYYVFFAKEKTQVFWRESLETYSKNMVWYEHCIADLYPVRLSYSAKSATIQQCFSLITNQ
jgi:hypothetical protein